MKHCLHIYCQQKSTIKEDVRFGVLRKWKLDPEINGITFLMLIYWVISDNFSESNLPLNLSIVP